MDVSRRKFLLCLAPGAVALPTFSPVARAQAYPARPVRIIVTSAAGGTQDILARLIGQSLSERVGQPFVIENRPGAGGNIGTEAAVKASPDGYTLLMIGPPNAINATLYEKLNYNFLKDISPIASISREAAVIVVNPSLPAKTLPELIDYAKSNPDKISMGSAGIGTMGHVPGELFKIMTGVRMVHVPYRGGGPAIADLLGGQVQLVFGSLPTSIEYIRTGRLRALAVTTAKRSETLPDIPTVSELVRGYEASSVWGLGAPKNTAVELIERLNKEINAVIADPKMKARIADAGGMVLPGSPADFGKLLIEETEKWGKVIKSADIKSE
jgi:tripartite-type tricarboxylate transporter receptor subunit TctC